MGLLEIINKLTAGDGLDSPFPKPQSGKINIVKTMYLINVSAQPIEKLPIQYVPKEIKVSPVANWAAVASLGRNNPFYQYTGGEDNIRFTLDWHSVIEKRDDVINACRTIESWSRADGENEPPTIVFVYGQIFKNSTWIVKSAPYDLTDFVSSTKKRDGSFINHDLLPIQAYQEVTLARITDQNRDHDEIRNFN